jgi:hypothetical protein
MEPSGSGRFAVRRHPLAPSPLVADHVEAVVEAMAVAVFAELFDRRPRGFEPRRKPMSPHEVPNHPRPQPRQRLVVAAIVGVRRAAAFVEMKDSLAGAPESDVRRVVVGVAGGDRYVRAVGPPRVG